MKNISKKSIAVTCCLMLLNGCAIVSRTENRAEIEIEKLKADQLIGLSKEKLLQRFGPPLAIARHNGPPLYIPSNSYVSSKLKKEPETLEAIFAFNKFSKQHIISTHHVIYLYQSSTVSGRGLVGVHAFGSLRSMNTSLTLYRFWILIDSRTSKVVDYIAEEI